MQKTILITGSTDGIGLESAKALIKQGDNVLIHGRSSLKVKKVQELLSKLFDGKNIQGYVADLSNIDEIKAFIKEIKTKYQKLDVLINNAGIYKTSESITKDGIDIRFAVNTIAPYVLTKELAPLLDKSSRVINLSSAAQAPIDLEALKGKIKLDDAKAYAQSKLGVIMWSNFLAKKFENDIGVIVSLNPASFLGSKMVKEAYGMSGKDINIGVDIITRMALLDQFSDVSGKYFDNDIAEFTSPHADALDMQKCKNIVDTIESILSSSLKI